MSGADVEVAVAGAGPVGLVLAAALRNAGVEVAVFEAGSGLPRESEASTIHASTLEVLDWLGVADDFVRTGQLVDRVQYRDERREVLAELPFALLDGRTRFPFRLHAEQWRLTPLLLDRVRDAVAFRTPVVAAGHGAEGAWLEVDDGARRRRVRARWVVAADGAHSTVRSALGEPFPGEQYPFRLFWVKTPDDVRAEVADLAPLTYLSLPADDLALLQHLDHWRVVLRIPETEAPGALEPAYRRSKLRAAFPTLDLAVGDARVVNLGRRVVERYAIGRACFVGDAAHICGTHGGMGMNTGIHDAASLAAVLACSRGRPHRLDAALERWAAWRRAVMCDVVLPRSEAAGAPRGGASDPVGRGAWEARLRALATDEAAAREWLVRSSLLDVAPVRAGEPVTIPGLEAS